MLGARLMPWCDDCSKFWNPNSMPADGTCPTCGRKLAASSAPAAASGADPRKVDLKELAGEEQMPWHFKLLSSRSCSISDGTRSKAWSG